MVPRGNGGGGGGGCATPRPSRPSRSPTLHLRSLMNCYPLVFERLPRTYLLAVFLQSVGLHSASSQSDVSQPAVRVADPDRQLFVHCAGLAVRFLAFTHIAAAASARIDYRHNQYLYSR